MIELRENAIRYFTDNLVFSVVIDTDNDVSFHVYDKNIMDYIYSYIIDVSFSMSENMTKEQFLQNQLLKYVCHYYNKQKEKFLDKMIMFTDNYAYKGGIYNEIN